MDNLTVEQRIEKIIDLAGDDIGVIINMTFYDGIKISGEKNISTFISGNTVKNSTTRGISLVEWDDHITNPQKYYFTEHEQGIRYKLKEDVEDNPA